MDGPTLTHILSEQIALSELSKKKRRKKHKAMTLMWKEDDIFGEEMGREIKGRNDGQ